MRIVRLVLFGIAAAAMLIVAALLAAQIIFVPHLTGLRTVLTVVLLAGAILAAIGCFRQFRNVRGPISADTPAGSSA